MTTPPRTPTMRDALEQIASLIQSLPRSATADQIHAVARAALAAEESGWLPTHRHYKGGLYRVLGNAVHTEDGTELVAYEDQDRFIWVRPRAMFNEKMPDGRLRFSPLPPAPAAKEPSARDELEALVAKIERAVAEPVEACKYGGDCVRLPMCGTKCHLRVRLAELKDEP